jgi:uncharacterized protein HemX
MSSKGKNTQLLVAGLVAAAAIGAVLYYSKVATAKEPTKKKSKKLDDDNDNVKQKSSDSAARSVDVTPKKSNLSDTDEKQMHSKIEELDKKGKALFKNKQASPIHDKRSFSHSWCIHSRLTLKCFVYWR